MAKEKLAVILNPIAGMQVAKQKRPEIEKIFTEAGFELLMLETNASGDGTILAEKYGPMVDRLVCVGGDGTLNEVVTGLVRSGCTTPLGYIPAGTTNDFAHSLGLSSDIAKAAKDIVSGRVLSLDVGQFAHRYFTYIASFGAFTRVSYSTPQNIKNVFGHFAYILEGIKDIPYIHPEHLRIEVEEQVYEGDYIFGAITNSVSVGGVLKLDPHVVDMSDGLFEILLIKQPANPLELCDCIAKLNSQSYEAEMITFIRAHRATIYANPNMEWTLDGEKEEGHAIITVENLKQQLKFIVPPQEK
jgi:diacylglycerol kinase (ATP)